MSPRAIHFVAPSLSVILTACAPMDWNKPGASQSDFSQDRYDCLQQAQQHGSAAYLRQYGVGATDKMETNDELFRTCMNAKGWYLRRQTAADS